MSPTRARRITAGFFFLSGLLTASWSSRIPNVQDSLGLNNAAWGSVLVALPVGMCTGLVVSGWLVSRFGTRKIIFATCASVAVLLLCLGLAQLRIYLMIALFFTGFFRSVMNISMNANAIEVQQLYSQPILSTFHGIWSLACFVAAGIGTLMIIGGISPAVHFLVIGAAGLLSALLLTQKNTSAHVAPAKSPLFVRPDRYLWLLGGIAFCGMVAENTMFDWSVSYFEKTLAVEKSRVTIGYSSFIIAMTIGRLAGDRLIHLIGRVKLLLLNSLFMGTGFVIAAAFPSLWAAAFGFLLVGLGDSTIVPIVYALAARSSAMPAAYAITAVTTIGYGGFLLAPLMMGGLSQWFGMQWALAVVAVLAFGILPVAMLVRRMVPQG